MASDKYIDKQTQKIYIPLPKKQSLILGGYLMITRFTVCLTLLFSFSLTPLFVYAATLNCDPVNGTVTSISGLVVNGTTYDVTFNFNDFDSLFNPDHDYYELDQEPTFWGKQLLAAEAAELIMYHLGTTNYTFYNYNPELGEFKGDLFVVPYGPGAEAYEFAGYKDNAHVLHSDFLINSTRLLRMTGPTSTPIAIFDPVDTVPVPTTILLFGSGLLGLAGFKRRSKK